MPYSTEEEIRAAKCDAMGTELGELHFALWREVVWLHLKWNEYRALFGTSPEEIELLNQVAPAFFYQVERALWQRYPASSLQNHRSSSVERPRTAIANTVTASDPPRHRHSSRSRIICLGVQGRHGGVTHLDGSSRGNDTPQEINFSISSPFNSPGP